MVERMVTPVRYRLFRKASYDLGSEYGHPTFYVKTASITGEHIPTMLKFSESTVFKEVIEDTRIQRNNFNKNVVFKINDDGTILYDEKSNCMICYKLQHVIACDISKQHPDIIILIAARNNEHIRCHVLLCKNDIQAKNIFLTLKKRFEVCKRKIQKQYMFTTTFN